MIKDDAGFDYKPRNLLNGYRHLKTEQGRNQAISSQA